MLYLVTSRNDLIRKYDTENVITKEILFPLSWKEEKIIGYIEEFIYMMSRLSSGGLSE